MLFSAQYEAIYLIDAVSKPSFDINVKITTTIAIHFKPLAIKKYAITKVSKKPISMPTNYK